jgi:ubiquinone/menaquinone biosynthesis C-methylase UbiE
MIEWHAMSTSLTFDQAASFYDKTRALPDWVSQAVTDSIVDLARLNPASQVLEIGIGTGRIALPLLRRGLPIIGMDLSLPMMEELHTKIGRNEFHVMLAQADANELPFAAATFDCVLAVHVYHLVANWQNALAQAWRVIKPGGCFLVTYHRRNSQSPNRMLRRRLFELAQEQGIDPRRPGSQSYEELRAEVEKHGATQVVQVARWHERTITIAQILDDIKARLFSDTWTIPEDTLARAMPALREWAQTEFGSLGFMVREDEEFSWIVAHK